MYLLLVTVETKPGSEMEGKKWIQESLAPLLKKAKGFKSFTCSLDRTTNKGTNVYIWESKEDWDTFRVSAEWQKLATEAGSRFYASQPNREGFEVIFHI